jgi:hypothetical protein
MLLQNFLLFLPILPKIASVTIKGFSKADSSHIKEFPKAACLDNFYGFFNTVCGSFWKPSYVAISGFRKNFLIAFLIALIQFKILLNKQAVTFRRTPAPFSSNDTGTVPSN